MFLTTKRQPQMASDFNEVLARLSKNYVSNDTGVAVTEKSAMRQTTVYACVRIISEIIAQLPLEVQQRQNGAWVNSEEHRVKRVLAEPNEWQTQHDFMQFLVSWAELSGNSHYYKLYNGANEIAGLIPIESTGVDMDLHYSMEVHYSVSTDYGLNGRFKKDRILHHRNFGTEGYRGISTIGAHARGIGLAVQLESHAVGAYKNGLQSKKWLELEDGSLTQEQKTELEAFLASFSGASNSGKIPYFAGATLHDLGSMSEVDAQYIETRKLQSQQIAAIFGVPLFLLNDTENNTTWGSGLEQISRAFVRFSLNPRLNRIKQMLHREFIREGAKRSTRINFDTDQFTLGEFKDRMEAYRAGIEAGVLNPDNALELEGRNPRPDGDKYRIPANIMIEGRENGSPETDA